MKSRRLGRFWRRWPAASIHPVAQANMPSRRIAESLGGVPVSRRQGTKYDTVVYRIPASR
ncbi:hypothetical protein [Paracidovorax cattleyae]|uniref:hypothetical protein n=1 Tax=Paracidovorax cattleyae TaxID=80868 RepID=UPI0018651052